jgi:hypothetical protein
MGFAGNPAVAKDPAGQNVKRDGVSAANCYPSRTLKI